MSIRDEIMVVRMALQKLDQLLEDASKSPVPAMPPSPNVLFQGEKALSAIEDYIRKNVRDAEVYWS